MGTLSDGGDQPRRLGALLGLLWLNLLNLLSLAFAYSFFWTVFTINYFLMRERDDGTPLTDVYLPEEHDQDEMAPVVGVAASEQPVIERPSPADSAGELSEHIAPPTDGASDGLEDR